MFAPAATGFGDAVFVTPRSAETATADVVVVAVALLFAAFGSVVVLVSEAVFVIVDAAGTAAPTWTTSENDTFAPVRTVGAVQVTAPVPPTGGVVHVNPAPDVSETNVVFAGMLSVSTTDCASLGPGFVTAIV